VAVKVTPLTAMWSELVKVGPHRDRMPAAARRTEDANLALRDLLLRVAPGVQDDAVAPAPCERRSRA